MEIRSQISGGPRRERYDPTDDPDESPRLIEQDQTDVERDLPLGENKSIEREADETDERPAFDQ